MRMDSRIPMMGQGVNALGAIDAGNRARAFQEDAQFQNALRPIKMQSAQLDVQQQRLGLEKTRLDISEVRRKAALEAQNAKDKAAAAKELEQAKQGMMMAGQAFMAKDPQAWGMVAREFGVPDLPMDETGLKFLDAMVSGFGEGLSGALSGPEVKPTDDIREYQFAQSQGFKGTFQDWQTTNRKAGASNTNVNVSTGENSGVTDKFYETLDKGQADMYQALLSNGMAIPSRIAQLDEMEALLKSAPTGAEAGIKFMAGNFGINTEGLDDLQAAQAIINRLVPAQRPAGSGPMSDADLELFKQSLPRLINTREGNQTILNTLRGIAIYEMQQAEIAQRVATREITPAQGLKELSNLQNPLSVLRRDGKTTIGGYTITEVE